MTPASLQSLLETLSQFQFDCLIVDNVYDLTQDRYPPVSLFDSDPPYASDCRRILRQIKLFCKDKGAIGLASLGSYWCSFMKDRLVGDYQVEVDTRIHRNSVSISEVHARTPDWTPTENRPPSYLVTDHNKRIVKEYSVDEFLSLFSF